MPSFLCSAGTCPHPSHISVAIVVSDISSIEGILAYGPTFDLFMLKEEEKIYMGHIVMEGYSFKKRKTNISKVLT